MKKINEELNYIKYLFGYQKGVVISEQTTPVSNAPTQPQTQSTPASEPTQGGDECLSFSGTGTFSEGNADTDNAHLEKLIGDIVAKFPNGGNVTSMKIIGGASNAVGGVATAYDLDNNYTVNPSPETTPRGPKYQKNIGYATNRANTAKQPILDGLKNANINVSVEPTIEAKVINTGGKTDTENAGAMNQGQIVIVEVVVCPTQGGGGRDEITTVTTTVPTVLLEECFEGSEITIYYNGKGHYCDHAVYDIVANGIKLKRRDFQGELQDYASLNNVGRQGAINLDNGIDIPSGEDTSKCAGGICGRSNTFILDKITNESFFNEDVLQKYQGTLVVTAACVNKGQGKYDNKSDCHTDVGMIKFNIKKMGVVQDEVQKSTPNMFNTPVEIGRIAACKGYKQQS